MKLQGNFSGFQLSSKGLSLQRKKMDIIAQNIANAETTRTETGQPYKKKILKAPIIANSQPAANQSLEQLRLLTTRQEHYMNKNVNTSPGSSFNSDLNAEIIEDSSIGDLIFMPNHPDADEKGYVEASNVSIINEMVEMIEATRNYEANLKALNASKEMIKDSLEI